MDLDCLVDALWAHISASEAAMGALTHDCAISAPSLIWWTSASVSLETHAGSEVRKVKQINNRANLAKNRLLIARWHHDGERRSRKALTKFCSPI